MIKANIDKSRVAVESVALGFRYTGGDIYMAKVPIDALKSNSHKSREPDIIETPKAAGVKQVASGKIRKKKLGDKVKDAFIAEDAKTVKEYVFFDVFIPGLKDLTMSILHGGIDMIFTGRGSRGSSRKGGFYNNQHNYSGYYSNRSAEPERSPRTRTYENVTFESRADAERVLEDMKLYLDEYHRVSIATFNELAGVTGDYTDNRIGWRSLAEAKVMYHQGEYFIDFPRPKDLNI